MGTLRAAIKLPVVVGLIATYLAQCALIVLLVRSPIRRRRAQLHSIAFYSRVMMWVFGARVEIREGAERLKRKGEPTFLVSNHLSYFDVLVLSSQWPSAFVTSVEVQRSAGLGWIVKLGGCLFVERRSRERLEAEKREIADVIQQGISVFVFPEATSTDGEVGSMIPFKGALFDCAILAGVPVQPITLNYIRVDGEVPTREMEDRIYYYGEMNFLPQLIKLCRCKSIVASLTLHAPLVTAGADRKKLAQNCFSIISESYAKVRANEGISRTHASPIDRPLAQQ